MTKDTMLGWWFATEDRTLPNGDGRKVVVGKSHKVCGRPILCQRGLHASARCIDALQHAPGPILYRVELRGVIICDNDKACATERHYTAEINAEAMLREFARKCALNVIHRWDAPRVVRDYLETGNEELRAAAGTTAYAAAWAAAADAASAAARDAARAAQTAMLEDMALAAIKKKKSRRRNPTNSYSQKKRESQMRERAHTCGAPKGPAHRHRCRHCRTEWSHSEASKNCEACHECPTCGRPQYVRAGGLSEFFCRWFDEVA